MSNSGRPHGEGLTRRTALRRMAFASMLTQAGCTKGCVALLGLGGGPAEIMVLYLWGQAGSSLVPGLIPWVEERTPKDGAASAGSTAELSSERRPRGSLPELIGISRGSASGPPPPGLTGNGVTSAVYLLDSLGDGEVDGRVYALDSDGEALTLRGQVGLRPADRTLPSPLPQHIALSADGSQIIVSQEGEPPQWIFIDTATLTISARVMTPPSENARRALFSPDGRYAYLVGATSQLANAQATVHIADVSTHAIIDTVPLPERTSLSDLIVTPDAGLLIGADFSSLHVVDLRTATYGGRIRVSGAGGPQGRFRRLIMAPSGSRFYAGLVEYPDEQRHAIAVFDVRSIRQTGEITIRERPTGMPLMNLSPSGATLFYATQLGSVIQILDPDSGAEFDTFPVEEGFRLTTMSVA